MLPSIRFTNMRTRIYWLFLLIIASMNADAQDVIVLTSGDSVLSKVQEINQTEIKYKKFSNPDGPLYVIDKSTVASITYANGDKDTFVLMPQQPSAAAPAEQTEAEEASYGELDPAVIVDETPVTAEPTTAVTYAEKATDNKSLIDLYNTPVQFVAKKQSSKAAQYVTWKFGVTENSVLSGEDIDIRIEFLWSQTCCQYGISIHNKTDKTIFIDREKSFCIDETGTRHTYFNDNDALNSLIGSLKEPADTLKTAAAARLNSQRTLTIEPHGSGYLSVHDEAVTKKDNLLTFETTKILSHCENLYRDFGKSEGFIKVGETKTFTEQDTPARLLYTIYYTTGEASQTAQTQTFGLYIQQAFGGRPAYDISNYQGDYSQTWKFRQSKRTKQLEKYIKQVKKVIPSYCETCIIGGHILGNEE